MSAHPSRLLVASVGLAASVATLVAVTGAADARLWPGVTAVSSPDQATRELQGLRITIDVPDASGTPLAALAAKDPAPGYAAEIVCSRPDHGVFDPVHVDLDVDSVTWELVGGRVPRVVPHVRLAFASGRRFGTPVTSCLVFDQTPDDVVLRDATARIDDLPGGVELAANATASRW